MNILIAIVSGFASGVFLRSVFNFGWPVIVFIFILAALLSAAVFLKSRRVYSLGAIFLLLTAFGMLRTTFIDSSLPDAFLRDVKHRVSYDGIVVSDPDVRDANQRVQIRVTSGGFTPPKF